MKHFDNRHGDERLHQGRVKFLNVDNEEVAVPHLELMDTSSVEYKTGDLVWLTGVAEQINSSLHPDFPGKQ